MIGIKIDQAKGMFFDAPKVVRSVDKTARRVLSRFGAYVRTAAQSSMLGHTVRKGFGAKSKVTNRSGSSKPGSPPNPHTGDLVKFIFFGYDASQRSVVIGPVKLNKSTGAPETLEYGGTATISQRIKPGKYKTKRVRIAARPYMQPALKKELPKLPAMWANSVK